LRTIRLVIFGSILVFAGCGIRPDPLQCEDLCDQWRICNPAVADPDWDICFADCHAQGYSRGFVDCVLTKPCDPDFEKTKEECILRFDELLPPADSEVIGTR